MAGKTASKARDAFFKPIQRALSCVTKAQIHRPPPRGPGEQEGLTLSEDPIFVRTRQHDRVGLSIAQQFRLVETDDPERGPWKVSTLAYWYRVENDSGRELVSWHWHPLGHNAYEAPHLHVGWPEYAKHHLPTERVSIEAVIRFLITELDVVPQKSDWAEVLDRAEAMFRRWRTWPGVQ